MYEVELKAEITHLDNQKIINRLKQLTPFKIEHLKYKDVYLDNKDKTLSKVEKELRIRTIERDNDNNTHILTYKHPPFDHFSKSKEEFETKIENVHNLMLILHNLGYVEYATYEKMCVNYHFNYTDYQVLATFVTLSFSSRKFLEIEILTSVENYVENAKIVLVNIFKELSIHEFTNEYYTEIFLEWKINSIES